MNKSFRALLIAAAIVIVIAGMRAAAPVLAPLALAFFIAIVSLPALQWMRRRGAPAPLAIFATVLLDAAVLAAVATVIVEAIGELRIVAPSYFTRLQELETLAAARFESWGYEVADSPLRELANPERLFVFVANLARRLTGIFAVAFLIVLYIVFTLVESVGLSDKLTKAFGNRRSDYLHLGRVLSDVQHYLGLKTLVSLCTGGLIGAGAAVIGVDFALFWGFLAFVLNYIPTFGSIIAAVPAVSVALLQLGVGPASALGVVFIVVNLVLGSILDPIIVGRRLGLSTLVALFSLIFWGWMWGPIGLFLAVPITASAKIIMENSANLKWIAILLGPVPDERPTNPREAEERLPV